jgi:Protein of unknown function (DUF3300)
MRKTLAILLIFSITYISPYSGMQIQVRAATPPAAAQEWDVQFSPEQLENLVAPIALYPDPLLAQVLLAATFPDQIDAAAREVRAYGTSYNIDLSPWDVSVKAVAHYPTVLSMMADKLDWTTTLGQAYVTQPADLMDAVQRLRHQARSYGHLVTTSQQQIVESDGYIYIYPAQAEYIYVPTYDPAVVYVRSPWVIAAPIIAFGVGLLIGAWLNHDCDWHHHNVYYHGWGGYGYGPGPVWVGRSRSHIRINNVYVNNTYNNVVINRTVINRNVNYGALNRYNTVHRDVDYNNVRRERGPAGARPQQPRPTEAQKDNKIIRRNIDPNDPRINANRGRGQLPQQAQPEARKPDTVPGATARPGTGERRVPPGQVTQQPQVTQPAPRVETRPERGERRLPPGQEKKQPQVTQPGPQPRVEAQAPRTPRVGKTTPPTTPAQRGNVVVPREQPRVTQPAPQQRAPESVFRGSRGGIDPGAASRRGQASRIEQSRPAPQAQAPRSASPGRSTQAAPRAQSAPRTQGNAGQAPKGAQRGSQGGAKSQGRHK